MAKVGALDPNRPALQTPGLVISIVPGDFSYPVEIQRAPDNGSDAPNAGSAVSVGDAFTFPKRGGVFVDELPYQQARWWYRWRHVIPGGTAGSWTGWVGARPDIIPQEYIQRDATIYPVRRDEPMVDGKHAALAEDPTGETLAPSVVQSDGTNNRVIAKGHQAGLASDGDAVTFPVAFENPPMILLRGGVSYEPRAGQWSPSYDSTKPQYDELLPLNLTASGFTLRARLRQKGAQTGQKDDFPASNVLDALSETTAATLDPAGATGDQYTVRYDVMLRITCPGAGKPPASGSITVAIDTNDGGGWVERAAYTYAHSVLASECAGSYDEWTWTAEAKTIVVSGLGTSDQIRLRIKTVTGGGAIYGFEVHGWREADDGTAGVTYQTATDAYATKTPDTEDMVEWEAMAVA